MNVTIIQTNLYWENRDKNLEHFSNLFQKITEPTDLIIVPEMFTTGFTMDPEKVAEPHLSTTYNWLLQKAKEKNATIVGSVAITDDNKYYNRLHWIEPNGNSNFYDKRHLFRMANEDQKYTPGNKKIIMQLKDWKILPLICYDLRFPVWSRNFKDKKSCYDVLIYVASWPETRNYPWKHLLIARAIENQCYVIGVNRIGVDGNNLNYTGNNMVVNPRGEIINQSTPNEEGIETVFLDKFYLDDFRKNFPVGLDSDAFELLD